MQSNGEEKSSNEGHEEEKLTSITKNEIDYVLQEIVGTCILF